MKNVIVSNSSWISLWGKSLKIVNCYNNEFMTFSTFEISSRFLSIRTN